MDPVTLLIGGLSYAAVAVAREASDDVAEQVWDRLKGGLAKLLRREPTLADVTPERARAVLESDPELSAQVSKLWLGTAVLRRAKHVARALNGARVLWIDDRPEDNALERQTMASLGLQVVTVETTRSATACLERESFDLIISDIDREGRATAGIDALPSIGKAGRGAPIVLYITQYAPDRGVPAGAFGITARPDDLLHLCMDCVERRRL